MTEAEMTELLRARYPAAEYAFFAGVRNGTGYSKSVTRTADAMALCLWPSRGMELLGFEIKCYRGDWIRELKNPAKAEAISAYCDRWWVVAADSSIVRRDELPPTWGLLVHGNGKLAAEVQAPKLAPKELDRPFVAALLRSASNAEAGALDARAAALAEKKLTDTQAAHEKERDRFRESSDRAQQRISDLEARLAAVSGQDWSEASRHATWALDAVERLGQTLREIKEAAAAREAVDAA